MKTTILAVCLFTITAAAVTFYPTRPSVGAVKPPPVTPPIAGSLTNERPKVEVVFALDTTGSMGGLIEAAKEKIWSVATTLASAQPTPEIRMGLVAYRDRGDAYVTRSVDLSSDLDSMHAALLDFRADGGGDGPESVNQALYETVHGMSWSQDRQAYKVVFLVGDAPPHMDYQDDVKYPETLAEARRKGVLVNTIQCGQTGSTTTEWQQIARLGDGRYFRVEQSGSAIAIATPFDARLAKLSAKLDDTRLYYGSDEEREKQARKLEATDKLRASSSVESRARRAAFNTTEGGEANFLGDGELIDDVSSGRVDLSAVDKDQLPAPLQAMSPGEQAALIGEVAERRNELKAEIKGLAKKRSAYLRQKVKQLGGEKESLDYKLYSTMRDQAAKMGMRYEADSPAY